MSMFDRLIKTEQRSLENPNFPVSADNFLHLMGWGDFNSSSGVVVKPRCAVKIFIFSHVAKAKFAVERGKK